MPPRWLRWIIVVSWLATTGWLFWHDLRPRWLLGEPPMFHVDLVEEVQKTSTPLKTPWTVERQDKKQSKPYPVFRASTWVERKNEDIYTLNALLDATKDPELRPVSVAKLFRINKIASSYRITRSGQLRAMEAKVDVRFHWEPPSVLLRFFGAQSDPFQRGASTESISLRIWGEVQDRQFFAHCSAITTKSPEKPMMQFDLPPAAVSHTGSVLMPLHPLNHLRGLRLGQGWRQPLVDPLQDAFDPLPGSSGVRWLNARVLPQPQVLELNGTQTRCLVIEYTNDEDELAGRTWVEQDGERVLQQESLLENSRWIMKREPSRRSPIRPPDS
jgi:hypothetical protein